MTAKNIASIDKLSGGRFVFGIGGGWNLDEMENHGVEHKSRFRQMREHVLAMKQLWTEETGEFHGEFVNFDPAYAEPKPTQRPHPPIILGGETDYTLKRVVEYCDGWLPRGPWRVRSGRIEAASDRYGGKRGSRSVFFDNHGFRRTGGPSETR